MADNFGQALMSTFFDRAFPMTRNIELELVSWDEVAKLFFEASTMIKAAADADPKPWALSSVSLLDTWLREAAERGAWDGNISVPTGTAQELWRRWQYVIMASMLEEQKGEPLNLPVPKAADDGMKGWALVLYMVGGPGRSYPRTMFDR